MNSKRFVYFDLGNVLVNFDHQIAVAQLAALSSRPPALVQEVLFSSNLQNRYETGLLTCKQFADSVNQDLQSQLDGEPILEAISDIFEPNDDILPVLETVKKSGLQMGILSNTCKAHWDWIARQKWPMLQDWFDVTVLSYEVGSMKPDAAIYEFCEQRAGCRGADVFFTDDRIENIQAAAKRNWQTYHFKSAEELLPRLQAWIAQT